MAHEACCTMGSTLFSNSGCQFISDLYLGPEEITFRPFFKFFRACHLSFWFSTPSFLCWTLTIWLTCFSHGYGSWLGLRSGQSNHKSVRGRFSHVAVWRDHPLLWYIHDVTPSMISVANAHNTYILGILAPPMTGISLYINAMPFFTIIFLLLGNFI